MTTLDQDRDQRPSSAGAQPTRRRVDALLRAREVTNVGETDLGGRPVPLYAVDEQNMLVESSPFASTFKPCPSAPFPKTFGPGDKAKVCLVFLAPDSGKLVAVSFRPDEDFDPITWTGEVRSTSRRSRTRRTRGRGGNDQ